MSARGYYGKLPTLGDFLSRGLPQTFIEPWDDWLQTGMQISREILAENWTAYYSQAPIWRFGLPAGLMGEHAWCGSLIPSVDRVGRFFPLALLARCPAETSLIHRLLDDAWFHPLDGLLSQVLRGAVGKDELDQFLETQNSTADSGQDCAVTHSADAVEMSHPVNLLSGLAAQHISATVASLGSASVWFTRGGSYVPPTFFAAQGMPPPRRFAAMLCSASMPATAAAPAPATDAAAAAQVSGAAIPLVEGGVPEDFDELAGLDGFDGPDSAAGSGIPDEFDDGDSEITKPQYDLGAGGAMHEPVPGSSVLDIIENDSHDLPDLLKEKGGQ